MKKFLTIPPKIEMEDLGEITKISISSEKPILWTGFLAFWFFWWGALNLGMLTLIGAMYYSLWDRYSEVFGHPVMDEIISLSPGDYKSMLSGVIIATVFVGIMLFTLYDLIVTLLWNLFGYEEIELNAKELILGKMIRGRGNVKMYSLKKVELLRLAPKRIRIFPRKIIPSGIPTIEFKYESKAVEFAYNIENSEAEEILSLINKSLQTASI